MEGNENKPSQKLDGGNHYGLTTSDYIRNIIIMTLLFTGFSFSFWLTDF